MTNEISRNSPTNTSENQVMEWEPNITSTSNQNAAEIVQNLDLVISQIGSQNALTLSSQSNKNLEEEIEGNRLYHMSETERQNLAQNFTGLERIIYDKLVEKVGTIQSHGAGLAAATVLNVIPFASIAVGTSAIGELNRAEKNLEKSFSVPEVLEIVNQSTATLIHGLPGTLSKISSGIVNMENRHIERERSLQMTIDEKTQEAAVKDEELAKRDREIENLRVRFSEASNRAEEYLRTQQAREQKEREQAQKEREVLEQQRNLLESSEQVAVRNLREIQADYAELEKQAKNKEELLELRERKISEYALLITRLEQEKDVLKQEWVVLNRQWQVLNTQAGRLEGEKLQVELKIEELQDEIEKRDGQLEIKDKIIGNWENKDQQWQNAANKWNKDREEQQQQIYQHIDENTKLKIQVDTNAAKLQRLEVERNQLQEKINAAEAEARRAHRVKRWALFASTVQGVTGSIVGEKWGGRVNTAIQVGTGAKLLSEMGDWTYDMWLMSIGMFLLFLFPKVWNLVATIAEKWTGVKLPKFNARAKWQKKLDEAEKKLSEFSHNTNNQAKPVVIQMVQPPQPQPVVTEKQEVEKPKTKNPTKDQEPNHDQAPEEPNSEQSKDEKNQH